jgi:glycosyltransferase involved in cell wall biosynthesis
MNVAWLLDGGNADGTRGGAELTMDGFRDAAPDTVEFTDLAEAETVVIGNCVGIGPAVIPSLMGRNVFRYHHDLAMSEDETLRLWLDDNATHIFTSPLHRERYSVIWHPKIQPEVHIIPPAMDLDRFKPNRQTRRNTKRSGTCSIASWQNPGKGGQLVSDYAERNDIEVDVYGPGAFAPGGPNTKDYGPMEPSALPAILWEYETFVFLPVAPEPFGRCVVEAHAAGCEVITNELVGAKHVLETDPGSIDTAPADFWDLVCQ